VLASGLEKTRHADGQEWKHEKTGIKLEHK
jgi:hypothetical protein